MLMDSAAVFRQTFRDADILARVGGDEFAVLATDAKEIAPELLSERLQRNIDAHNSAAERPYALAMSWGIAVYDPDTPVSMDELMAWADERMYEVKKKRPEGGHRPPFDPSILFVVDSFLISSIFPWMSKAF